VPEVLVLEMHQVLNLDTSALEALQELHAHLQRHGGRLLIAELTGQPLSLIERSGFREQLGRDALFARTRDALEAARGVAGSPPAEAE